MLSKLKVKFFSRFDVKLTVFYTFALLLISLVLSSFFYYRLQHNLLKQIDRMLKDEVKELIMEIEEENHLLNGCKLFFEDISNRAFYPVFFRVMASDGVSLCESENFSTILSKGIKEREHFTVTVDHRKKNATAFMKQGLLLRIRGRLSLRWLQRQSGLIKFLKLPFRTFSVQFPWFFY